MTWVKFHEELTGGAKRGLKREHRFVYLELSLLSRPRRGSVPLPVGMSDVDGVCDLLGGDAKQVRAALSALTAGKEPMVAFEGDEGDRALVVLAWSRWNATESAGASTERSRRHRVAATGQRQGNGDATIVADRSQRSSNGDATGCNDLPSGDQSRVEKIRSDPPVVPPSEGQPPKDKRASRCPPSEADPSAVADWLTAIGAPTSDPETSRFLDHHRAKGTKFVDWRAAWRNWSTGRFASGGGFQRKSVQPMGPSQSKRIDEDTDDSDWLPFPEASR